MRSIITMSDMDPNGLFARMLPAPLRKYLQYNDSARFKLPNLKLRKYQRGVLHPIGFWHASAAGGGVALTNHTSSHFNSGGVCNAGWDFEPNGQLGDVGPGALDRTYTATGGEWYVDEPSTDIGSDYDLMTDAGGNDYGFPPTGWTDATWTNIGTSGLIFTCRVTVKGAPSTDTGSKVFSIRNAGSGSALDSATLSAEASN